jgi:two-component system NarL family response regulator
MSGNDKVSILIADDHPAVREGLATILERQPDFSVVAQASTGQEVLDLVRLHHPTVTILDLRLPGMDGVEVIAALRAQVPAAQVMVLTTSDSTEDIYASVRAGARAYLLKETPCEELLDTVRAVARGETVMSPTMITSVTERMGRTELSKREKEILQHIAAGRTNQEIATALFITEGTVKSHVNSLLAKLHVTSRTEAVTASVKSGLVRLN